MKYLILFGLVVMAVISGFAATYIFSGIMMFVGLVMLVETIPMLKFFVKRTGALVDIAIFGFSVYALADMGATVSLGLSVAGLLFTVYYKPYLRRAKGNVKHTL